MSSPRKGPQQGFISAAGAAFVVLAVGALGVILFNAVFPATARGTWTVAAPAGAVILSAQAVAYLKWREYNRVEVID